MPSNAEIIQVCTVANSVELQDVAIVNPFWSPEDGLSSGPGSSMCRGTYDSLGISEEGEKIVYSANSQLIWEAIS